MEITMSNIAYVNFCPHTKGEERHVVDTDNGYTRLANELLEAILRAGLTQNQLLIALAVIRKTYGFNKKRDWVSNAQLSALTGLPETRCSTVKNELIKLGILISAGRSVGINKAILSWKTKVNTISKTLTVSVKKTFKETVNRPLQNLLTTKDTITKDKKDNIKIVPIIPKSVAQKINKATQQPSGFTPSEKHTSLANELGVNLLSEFAVFVDYHASKGSKFKNWDAALNTWLRNAVKFGIKPQSASHRMTENFNEKHYGVSDIPVWME